MPNLTTLVHCLDINIGSDSSHDEHYLPATNKPKEENMVVDKLPEAEFENLTYSNDDFKSDDDDDWVVGELQDIVQQLIVNFHAYLVRKRKDPSAVTIPCSIGPYDIN